jgi:hypothetical protein
MTTRFLLALLLTSTTVWAEDAPTRFLVRTGEALATPYTGRVYVMLGTTQRQEPRRGPDWFNPKPFFAVDVDAWTGETPVVFDADAMGHPWSITELQDGDWTLQAVLRSGENSGIGTGAGTRYSAPMQRTFGGQSGDISLTIDQEEMARDLPPVDGLEWVTLESPMLTKALGRPIHHQAAVIPPPDFDPDSERTWPVLYVIGGFPGGISEAGMTKWVWGATPIGKACFLIHLVAESPTGHHVFADSPGNGPRGTALIEEFIPHLESRYPLRSEARSRILTGHSSGGWSTLWLQLNWPDVFGGTWSTAPDPVDFRDFQQIDIYADAANAFIAPSGDRRPLARMGRSGRIWYDDFVGMESVMGDGGQIRSFDWVFSPLGDDGMPRRLIDPDTGAIDPEVAAAWRAYDINLLVQRDWKTLGPKVAGKIHIIGGSEDTFYLEGAVELLQETLQELGSDADIELVEGADHSNFLNRSRRRQMARQMLDAVTP